MSNESIVIGEWVMRRGDRLPLFSVVIEDDGTPPQPADLTGGTAWLQLPCEGLSAPLTLPDTFPPHQLIDGWLVLQAYIYNGPGGVVVYDWPNFETARVAVRVDARVTRGGLPHRT